MSKFENTKTGVVVSVDDSKDDRFGQGWVLAGSVKTKRRGAKSPEPETPEPETPGVDDE